MKYIYHNYFFYNVYLIYLNICPIIKIFMLDYNRKILAIIEEKFKKIIRDKLDQTNNATHDIDKIKSQTIDMDTYKLTVDFKNIVFKNLELNNLISNHCDIKNNTCFYFEIN